MKFKYKITGIDCPVCASKLLTMIAEIDGIDHAKINFFTERLTVETELDEKDFLPEIIKTAKAFSGDVEIS